MDVSPMSTATILSLFERNGYHANHNSDGFLCAKKNFHNFSLCIYGFTFAPISYKILSISCEHKRGGSVSIIANKFVNGLTSLIDEIDKIDQIPYENVYDWLLWLVRS